MVPDKETFLFASTATPLVNSIIFALTLRVLVERFAFWISITPIGQIKGMIYFLLLLMVLPWKLIKCQCLKYLQIYALTPIRNNTLFQICRFFANDLDGSDPFAYPVDFNTLTEELPIWLIL